jgi:Cu/Ag efflux pump CusA
VAFAASFGQVLLARLALPTALGLFSAAALALVLLVALLAPFALRRQMQTRRRRS